MKISTITNNAPSHKNKHLTTPPKSPLNKTKESNDEINISAKGKALSGTAIPIYPITEKLQKNLIKIQEKIRTELGNNPINLEIKIDEQTNSIKIIGDQKEAKILEEKLNKEHGEKESFLNLFKESAKFTGILIDLRRKLTQKGEPDAKNIVAPGYRGEYTGAVDVDKFRLSFYGKFISSFFSK